MTLYFIINYIVSSKDQTQMEPEKSPISKDNLANSKPILTLAQERQKITPGNNIDDDISKYQPQSSDDQELEEIDSDGDSMILGEVQENISNQVEVKQSKIEEQNMDKNIEKTGQKVKEQSLVQQQWDDQEKPALVQKDTHQLIEPSKQPKQNIPKYRQKKEEDKLQKNANKNSQDQKQFKVHDHPVDSKYIYALYLLFIDEIRKFMPLNQGYIKCNPRINRKSIKIGYYEDDVLELVLKKLEDFIDSIEVLEVPKKDVQSGVTMSFKYREHLRKQKLALFNDPNFRYKTDNTYLCGKVPKKQLMMKLNEMRKINFTWLHLFKYPDTRSYRKILQVIFEQPALKELIHQKFNARQIEVTLARKSNKSNSKMKGVTVILTMVGQKRLTIHQEIEEIVAKFISETYYLFCFTFNREKLQEFKKYVPSLEKVIIFYIHERHINLSYIFFLVRQDEYKEKKKEIIEQLINLNLNIRGVRYFRNLKPYIPEKIDEEYNVYKYPKYQSYSQTVVPRNNQKLDVSKFFI